MEPADLTVQILREIREDLRGLREDNKGLREDSRSLREDFRALREDNRAAREDFQSFAQQAVFRFEAMETTLRDLAQQMVMLARGVKVAIEGRGDVETRLEDVERRLAAIETRSQG